MNDFSPRLSRKALDTLRPEWTSAGSPEELERYAALQADLVPLFETSFPDPLAPKTVVVLPSTTLDEEMLGELEGELHYEERMLSMLMLLRMPRTHVIYITSVPLDPVIIDYYLHLLPGITGWHARRRLTLLSCYDSSPISLTQKVLERPRLTESIKSHILPTHPAHLACYNVTSLERTLAVRLGLPIYGCNPSLLHLGTKSGSRTMFQQAGIPLPAGFENIKKEAEIVAALASLKIARPSLRKAVIKINEGFGGEGNALFSYENAPEEEHLAAWIARQLPIRLKMVAPTLSYATFLRKFEEMQGIVEVFLDGELKTSPSVQCRVSPLGQAEVISTHDQVLGGESGQIFIGAGFPASAEYSREIGAMGQKIAEEMARRGVIGRFAVDFISVKEDAEWKHYAIEINLRKGGTTHPYLMLQFLTNGHYDADQGHFFTANDQKRYYFASDSLKSDAYRGTSPQELLEIAIFHGLHFDGTTQEGVMFHMIGALSEFGKLGVVCIGSSAERALELYQKTVDVLDTELGAAF